MCLYGEKRKAKSTYLAGGAVTSREAYFRLCGNSELAKDFSRGIEPSADTATEKLLQSRNRMVKVPDCDETYCPDVTNDQRKSFRWR